MASKKAENYVPNRGLGIILQATWRRVTSVFVVSDFIHCMWRTGFWSQMFAALISSFTIFAFFFVFSLYHFHSSNRAKGYMEPKAFTVRYLNEEAWHQRATDDRLLFAPVVTVFFFHFVIARMLCRFFLPDGTTSQQLDRVLLDRNFGVIMIQTALIWVMYDSRTAFAMSEKCIVYQHLQQQKGLFAVFVAAVLVTNWEVFDLQIVAR